MADQWKRPAVAGLFHDPLHDLAMLPPRGD
jgi:hypothetical protein